VLSIAPVEVHPPAEALLMQARLIPIRAGMQIIRYESAQDRALPPIVLLQAMPEDSGHVTLLSSREGPGASLEGPGDIVVVKATRDVRLVATTASVSPSMAVLKIERIGGRARADGSPHATVELIKRS
jgi:hypothetical protein